MPFKNDINHKPGHRDDSSINQSNLPDERPGGHIMWIRNWETFPGTGLEHSLGSWFAQALPTRFYTRAQVLQKKTVKQRLKTLLGMG